MPLRYEKLVKSFLGFLEGTKKSKLTVNSYRGDLMVFGEFLREKKLTFEKLELADLQGYEFYLNKKGLKNNTRRRKLLTAKSFYAYAWRRKKIAKSPARFLKTPARREVLPWIPTREEVRTLLKLSEESSLGLRNKIIIRILSETGLSLSEMCNLRWANVAVQTLKIEGKRSREIHFSRQLISELHRWREISTGEYIFPGFNRHGLFTKKMTPRGVELIMRQIAKNSRMEKLHPKSLRHFSILYWLQQGVVEKEIIRRLGVRQQYSLSLYKEYLAKLTK